VYAGTAKLAAGVNGDGTASNPGLINGASSLAKGASSLDDSAKTLSAGATKVAAGASSLKSGADEVNSGASKISTGASDLASGADTLYSGVLSLDDGAQQLTSGANDLMDGMMKFDTDGIRKLTSMFGSNVTDVINRLQAVEKAGAEYNTFTGTADTENSSVKFIYKTDSIGE
jgi:putative membrane protein